MYSIHCIYKGVIEYTPHSPRSLRAKYTGTGVTRCLEEVQVLQVIEVATMSNEPRLIPGRFLAVAWVGLVDYRVWIGSQVSY